MSATDDYQDRFKADIKPGSHWSTFYAMASELDELRAAATSNTARRTLAEQNMAALKSREFARQVGVTFEENFLDGKADGRVTFEADVLVANIRHAVRFTIEDITGEAPR